MEFKEEFLKTKIIDLTNQYKAIATLSALASVCNDYKNIQIQCSKLEAIHEKVISLVSKFCREEYIIAVKELDLSILPDYLKSLKIIADYRKILALRYSSFAFKNNTNYIKINKKSVEYNPNEEMGYLNIIKVLFKRKKYIEVIKMCECLLQTSTSTSPFYFMGQAYTKLGNYGKALSAYNKYFNNNRGHKEVKKIIDNLYKEIEKQ